MHEMSLAESIIQIVEEVAEREQAKRVKSVSIEIGELSSVQTDSLTFCFDAVTKGSVAEGAVFTLIPVPGTGWCMKCCAEVRLKEALGECPVCGSHQVQITGGTEMRVKELELE